MVKVTFIKDHPSGAKAGKTVPMRLFHANRLKAEGYVSIEGEEQSTAPAETTGTTGNDSKKKTNTKKK